MAPGDTATLAGLVFRFDSVAEVDGPNYRALRATLTVLQDGRELRVMQPEKRLYLSSGMPMTEAAIDASPRRDLYVALGDSLGDNAFAVRLQVKPLVDWIWGGCLVMAFGGLLAATDRRYRLRARAGAPSTTPGLLPKGAGA
jgi:cytochrome c-type biogenesis protein CcmF